MQSLVVRSITIETCPGGMILHQHEYLDNKLKQRDSKPGRPALPEVEEGKEAPATAEMKAAKSGQESRKQALADVGSLQWLACLARPSITAITASCARLQY